MKSLSTKLYIKPYYKKREDIELVVEFVNDSSDPVHISNYIVDAFEGGESSKMLPSSKKKNRFFRVAPKKTILKKVNLGKRFGGAEGMHELSFKLSKLEAHTKKSPNSITVKKLRLGGMKVGVRIGKDQTKPVLESHTVTPAIIRKLRHKALEFLSLDDLQIPPETAIARQCQVIGGTPDQQQQMTEAHRNGSLIAYQTLQNLRNDDKYRRWFGVYTQANFDTVKSTLQGILNGFTGQNFSYDLRTISNGNKYGTSDYNNYTIKFYKKFFDLGQSSKAAIVFHEHSHVSCNTRDNAYEMDECLYLASTDPDGAITNAMNYQFFAQG